MPVRTKKRRLFFDFTWRGVRCKEYTGLRADDPREVEFCEAKMRVIERQLSDGTFDYRQHFPAGTKVSLFYPEEHLQSPNEMFEDFIRRFHDRRSPFLPDGTVKKDFAIHPTTWMHDKSTVERLTRTFKGLRVNQLTVRRCNDFEEGLFNEGLSGKTVSNAMGYLHSALDWAVKEGLLTSNPVIRVTNSTVKRSSQLREKIAPLGKDEVVSVLAQIPDRFADFYELWFHLGWRPSVMVAIRWGWLDFEHEMIDVRHGRTPRAGGVEATPKTGRYFAACSNDPEIFRILARIKQRALKSGTPTGDDDYVFVDEEGSPLSQEWLHKRIWLPALKRAGVTHRGQYAIRDTFITWSLSAQEDPGWVAKICGTSEAMIFKHYRKWIRSLDTRAGSRIAASLRKNVTRKRPPRLSPVASPGRSKKRKTQQNQPLKMVEAGGIEPPSEDLQTMATTRLVRVLFSSRRRPRTGFLEASRLKFRTAAQSVNHDAPSPLNDASTRRRGRAAARR